MVGAGSLCVSWEVRESSIVVLGVSGGVAICSATVNPLSSSACCSSSPRNPKPSPPGGVSGMILCTGSLTSSIGLAGVSIKIGVGVPPGPGDLGALIPP